VAISKLELSARMASAGRPLASQTLSEWRLRGLLPPLVSRSKGLNKGKSCFWTDEIIFERAALVHDLLSAGVERHEIYGVLWLCGLSVPLSKVRRAWLHKSKKMKIAALRAVRANGAGTQPAAIRMTGACLSGRVSSQTLLDVALTASAFLDQQAAPEIDALVEAIDSFMTRYAGSQEPARPERRQVIFLVKSVWASVRCDDLVSASSDAELRDAQRYVCKALGLLRSPAERNETPGHLWPVAEALKFGTPLFFLVLIMLKSGQRAVLDGIVGPATPG
jgi:hypothetical protein